MRRGFAFPGRSLSTANFLFLRPFLRRPPHVLPKIPLGKLAAVSLGEVSMDDFEDWLVTHSWNMHLDSTPEAIELVSSIEFLLSERDDGIISNHDVLKGGIGQGAE